MNPLKLQILLGRSTNSPPPQNHQRPKPHHNKDLLAAKTTVRDLEKQSAKIDGFAPSAEPSEPPGRNCANRPKGKSPVEPGHSIIRAPDPSHDASTGKAKQAASALEQKERALVHRYNETKQSLQSVTIGANSLTAAQERLKPQPPLPAPSSISNAPSLAS